MTLEGWQARLTQTVAREMRRHRDRQKLSAQQLADRTAELGMPIPRNVLANLESGRRDTVSAAEVLVLAAALGVAPMELICPVGYDEQVELLPGRMMDPLMASRWVDGELALDVTEPEAVFRQPVAGDESGTRLAEAHESYLDEVRKGEAEVARAVLDLDVADTAVAMAKAEAEDAAAHGEDPAFIAEITAEVDRRRETASALRTRLDYRTSLVEERLESAARSLRYIRGEMRRRGMLLPVLPPSLKGIADDANGDAG